MYARRRYSIRAASADNILFVTETFSTFFVRMNCIYIADMSMYQFAILLFL